jgi:putative ABC transport system substrate-binding protein
MKRRTFLAATTIATAIVPLAHANERLVGWISPESAETTTPFTKAFLAGLAKQRVAGIKVLERYAPAAPDDVVPRQVEDLQQLGVKLIVAQGAATPPVMRAKPKVPVVFAFSGDPVLAGFAQSIARPGGNATGLTFMSVELMPKRVDLLR